MRTSLNLSSRPLTHLRGFLWRDSLLSQTQSLGSFCLDYVAPNLYCASQAVPSACCRPKHFCRMSSEETLAPGPLEKGLFACLCPEPYPVPIIPVPVIPVPVILSPSSYPRHRHSTFPGFLCHSLACPGTHSVDQCVSLSNKK